MTSEELESQMHYIKVLIDLINNNNDSTTRP